jgi:hypothetical protein
MHIKMAGMSVFIPNDDCKHATLRTNFRKDYIINGVNFAIPTEIHGTLKVPMLRPEVFAFENDCVLVNYQRLYYPNSKDHLLGLVVTT